MSKKKEDFHLKDELKEIFNIASASFLSRVAWTAMKFTDTTLILNTTVGTPQGPHAL